MVAELDRVGEGLETEGMVGEPRDRQRARDRTECDDELVIAHGQRPVLGLDRDFAPVGVHLRRTSQQELGVRTHLAQRDHDMARLERSRCSLRQHRRVEHEVLRRDDRRATLAEQTRDVASREPAAEHERATERLAVCHGLPLHGREVFHGEMEVAARRHHPSQQRPRPGLVEHLVEVAALRALHA